MGFFIAVEGPDGAGKGELIKSLHQKLFEFRKVTNVVHTREPTGSQFGREALEVIKSENYSNSHAFSLFCKDRKIHSNFILSVIDKVDFVITDRYYLSTAVHQNAIHDIALRKSFENHVQNVARPNLIIVKVVDEDTLIGRLKNRKDKLSIFEKQTIAEQRKYSEEYIRASGYFESFETRVMFLRGDAEDDVFKFQFNEIMEYIVSINKLEE